MLYISRSFSFNKLYITNKMEHFSFKSGRTCGLEAYKRTQAYSVTVKVLLKLLATYVSKVLRYKKAI